MRAETRDDTRHQIRIYLRIFNNSKSNEEFSNEDTEYTSDKRLSNNNCQMDGCSIMIIIWWMYVINCEQYHYFFMNHYRHFPHYLK